MDDGSILVVGCAGQLGSDCMAVLKEKAPVQGLDFPDIDITDSHRTKEVLDQIEPSVVINCAAYTAVDACESDPACWKVNADGPGYLAQWAAVNGAYLVHVSTDYVFDGRKLLYEAYVESDPPCPVSEYGKSKLAGERAVMESGAQAAILRTAWLYGEKGNNFLKTMLRLALQGPEREIRVVNDQFGSPTWSHSLARQIAAVVEERTTGLFHATSHGYCSWYDLASCFLEKTGVPFTMAPCSSADYPTAAVRPRNSILENQNLKDAGLDLFQDWRQELHEFVETCGASVLAEVKELIG